MKKLLAILLVAMLLVSAANAQNDGLHSVLVRKPVDAAVVPVGPKVVTPYVLGVRVYQPYAIAVEPRVDVHVRVVRPYPYVVPPPQKPIFATPLRDGVYYGTYYSRVWRFNRLGRLLNVQPVPGQVSPAPQPQPEPTPAPGPNPDPGPVTPNDP